MIQKNQHLLNMVNGLLDGMILFFSYLIVTYIRFDIMYGASSALSSVWSRRFLLSAAAYAIVLVFVFACARLYGSFRFKTVVSEASTLCWINGLGVICLMGFLYFTRIVDFSRLALGFFYLLSTALLIAKRWVVRSILRHFRALGFNQKHVVVVGNGHLAHRYIQNTITERKYGFCVDGYVSRAEKPELGKCLGSYEELEAILDKPGIDEVVVALETHEIGFMPLIVSACEKAGVRVSVIPSYNDYIPTHPTVDVIGDTKLINLRTTPLDNVGNQFIKRAFDIIASLLGLIVVSPILLVAAIGTKFSSPGPVLFRQERVGRGKELFVMYKFRSMRVNATQDIAWSKNEDARKTWFGSVLRKASIDELPQLFNVLKGDMSLIGPRPEIPHYVEQFKETVPLYMVKHQVRPGITGWAQVHGLRGDTSITERLKYDIWYIENWSVFLDIRILFMTVFGGMVNQEKLAANK